MPADLKREKQRRQEAGAAPSAHRITQGLIAHLAEIADACQAAAVTAVTDATAVAVSESTGTVSIFRGGRILVELEKPRSLGLPRASGA